MTQLQRLFADALAANNGPASHAPKRRRDEAKVVRPRVLTVWQPWAHLIIHGPKRVENRSWSTRYRGPLLIHAGSGWSRDSATSWEDYVSGQLDQLEAAGLLGEGQRPELGRLRDDRGHVLGRVDLVGERRIGRDDEDGFAIPGSIGWELEAPKSIKPYEAKGRPGLTKADCWVLADPPESTADTLTAFYAGGMRKAGAPIIACGERMCFGELIARVAEIQGSPQVATIMRRQAEGRRA